MRKGFLSLFLLIPLLCVGQSTDKADADRLIYEMLTANTMTENWHAPLMVLRSQLQETGELGIFKVVGSSFQIESLRSDFYVTEKDGRWIPLYDARFPMETMVNLLLNRLEDNQHILNLRHHQYGNVVPHAVLPMQNLYDLLARNMQLYCSVTNIDKKEMRAVLVFHQEHQNFIHLLEMHVGTMDIFDKQCVLDADFYTNIPQDNVNTIFKKRKQ